jgi:RNA polymerase sigma-70 factor (ECF subfamily)
MTRNAEDAKDISQEAFLRVYRALASFDGRSSLSTWLYRITVNLCLTHLRQQRSGREGEMSAPRVAGATAARGGAA